MQRLVASTALLPGGWASDVTVEIDAGRILRVTVGEAPQDEAPQDSVRVGCLLAAPVNLHSHAFQRAMAGRTERRSAGADSFWTWRSLMYRFLDHLTPDDVEAIAARVQMEMAEAGYAAVVEFHYLHHAPGGTPYDDPAEMSGRIAAAAETTGLGLTLLPVLYSQGGCDGRALSGGQLRFGCDLEGYARLWQGARGALAGLPDAVIGVAPHSLRAVSATALAEVALMAPDAPLHLHLAEQEAEVAEVLAFHGARPVEWLLANADVGARWCAIHCTQMTRKETLALAASGAVAGLCPITEANLGDGIFDGVAYAGAGGRYGIGSDSNLRIALAEELRGLEYSQRLANRGRAMMAQAGGSTARALWEAALAGGAQAAARDSGAIREGALADLVALDLDALPLCGAEGDDLLDTWIFAGDDRVVADVWSAGRHIVTGGRHVARDPIIERYRAVIASLRARM